eukprot:399286_1
MNSVIKDKTILNYPISPTQAISYHDIAGEDITKIDWDEVDEKKKEWCVQQGYKNAAVFAEMLNGRKCNKRYIQCVVHPLPLHKQGFSPLFNADMTYLWKHA